MNQQFKRIISSSIIALALSAPVMAALQPGATAPAIETKAALAGNAFDYSLQTALKNGPVVVYFYPSAYTGGCNIQAHTFAVELEKFTAAGASVIGVSLDSIDRLSQFSADPEFCANKVAVATDSDGSIAKAYELSIREAAEGKKDTKGNDITHGFAERTTFVVTPDGKIASTISGLKPAENVAKALEVVQQLAAKTGNP